VKVTHLLPPVTTRAFFVVCVLVLQRRGGEKKEIREVTGRGEKNHFAFFTLFVLLLLI